MSEPTSPSDIASAIVASLTDSSLETARGLLEEIEAIEHLGDGVIALIIGGRIFGITVAGGDKAEGA